MLRARDQSLSQDHDAVRPRRESTGSLQRRAGTYASRTRPPTISRRGCRPSLTFSATPIGQPLVRTASRPDVRRPTARRHLLDRRLEGSVRPGVRRRLAPKPPNARHRGIRPRRCAPSIRPSGPTRRIPWPAQTTRSRMRPRQRPRRSGTGPPRPRESQALQIAVDGAAVNTADSQLQRAARC